ncbi:DUF3231 family protein [Oceanobacillus manasiensis]|uniref:DUF3231 family protein n=1 Tax=Oceanobacillus manasiensis TaxID=586413 RepID=UPI000694FF2F|nr:DUF3231 family protein [Oceanobacillus manasiensis]
MEQYKKATASEIANLWASYMNASSSTAMLTYFKENVEDEDIRGLLNNAYDLSTFALETTSQLLTESASPVPKGFSEQDVNIKAPRLYSDTYMLHFAINLHILVMTHCTNAISQSSHEDIYRFYTESLSKANSVHMQAVKIAQTKGVYVSPPNIPTSDTVNFVKKDSFLNGWFGDKRPLLAVEIAQFYSNIERNVLGAATILGFAQVTESKEIKAYLLKGNNIAQKHVSSFSNYLEKSYIPVPMGSDSFVTESSQVSPFSDKLMLFYTIGMITQGIAFYGMSISTNARRDIATLYAKLSGEIAFYAEEGIKLMIDNDWFEEPPRMVDRKDLIEKGRD